MFGRRSLIAIVAFAAILHALGIARSIMPAQDGLKFLRVARTFQSGDWLDAIRNTDQHPLYPALVALTEPVIRVFHGRNPDTWRIAAQSVAACASLLLLLPLHGLAKALFDARVADLTVLGYVLLPLPMSIGHDTLSDSLALCAFLLALRLGYGALTAPRWDLALGCGLAAGFGFLARPEVLVAPMAVGLTGIVLFCRRFERSRSLILAPRLAGLAIVFLGVVGSYALVKGEVSEKLALRQAASIGPAAKSVRLKPQWLPKGLDDSRWNFAPKEEPARPVRRTMHEIVEELALQWATNLGSILAFFAIWGLARDRFIRRMVADGGDRPDDENVGRLLVAMYLIPFTLVLARHELRMGYLSDRHTLTLVALALPWAAAGVFVCARRLAGKLGLRARTAKIAGLALLTLAVGTGVRLQSKTAHPSRWGHREAGNWLAKHAGPKDAVLDTRGWATFIAGGPSYDYWHVRQAFTDSHLSYVVVGTDELNASSRRAATLRAVLAYAGQPVAGFPSRKGGHEIGVQIYRFEQPESWEGLIE